MYIVVGYPEDIFSTREAHVSSGATKVFVVKQSLDRNSETVDSRLFLIFILHIY